MTHRPSASEILRISQYEYARQERVEQWRRQNLIALAVCYVILLTAFGLLIVYLFSTSPGPGHNPAHKAKHVEGILVSQGPQDPYGTALFCAIYYV